MIRVYCDFDGAISTQDIRNALFRRYELAFCENKIGAADMAAVAYCQVQNITYHEFRTFADVQARLEELTNKKRLKPRREARMARQEVFLQG
jgi:2-hydroxy-3-keto-5-methylthiopentenyl-1-phosphate phosphatase